MKRGEAALQSFWNDAGIATGLTFSPLSGNLRVKLKLLTDGVMRAGRLVLFAGLALGGLSLNGNAMAQAALGETVTWSVQAPEAAKPGAKLALTLHGSVKDGWHVYSLKQRQDGPTPLLVSLNAGSAARAAGAVTESPPNKVRDAAFGFDTQFFDRPFTLTVPVRLRADLKAGPQAVAVDVRFQTCSGGTCQPPKTVHLSATVNIAAGA